MISCQSSSAPQARPCLSAVATGATVRGQAVAPAPVASGVLSADEAAMPQRVVFPHLGKPVGPYSHAVRHGSTLYLSGLTVAGTDAYGSDAGTQARAILGQIEQVLRQQRTGWEALIKVTVFVTGRENLAAVRAALVAAYGDNPPASSMVRVAGLVDPALKVEIEAIVAIPTPLSRQAAP